MKKCEFIILPFPYFMNSFVFYFSLFIQFYFPFNVISAYMRWANEEVGRKRENPEKKHMAYLQEKLGSSHISPCGA